jgi:hypothetical protein
LFCDFRELILYLGLYIKMELFSSIPQHLGFPVFLDVLGMALPVPLEVARMLIQPFFDSGVVRVAAVGIFLPPPEIILYFESFLASWISAGLLPRSHLRVGDKGALTIRTRLPFHLGLPLG